MKQNQRKRLDKAEVFTAILYVVGACTGTFMQTGLIACLPQIMIDFRVDANAGQWITAIYMLTNGIVIPATGYLMSRFQARHLLYLGMAIFALGCLGDFCAATYSLFLVFRIVQAIGTGIMLPLMQYVLFRLFPSNKRGTAMGFAGLAISGTPVVAPVITGSVCDFGGWRNVFLILCVCAVIILLVSLLAVRNDTEPVKRAIDIVSIPLLAVALTGLLYGINSLGSVGADNRIALFFILFGIGALFIFVLRQTRRDHPLLNLRAFKYGDFTIGCILIFFVYGAMMSNLVILSLYVETLRELSASTYALITLPGAIATMVLTPFAGRVLDKKGAFLVIFAGLLMLSIGFIAIGTSSIDTPLILVSFTYLLRCAGVACLVQTIPTWAVNSLPDSLLADGTALVNTGRQIGGSIISVLSILALTGFSAFSGFFAAVSYTFYLLGFCTILFACLFALRPKS